MGVDGNDVGRQASQRVAVICEEMAAGFWKEFRCWFWWILSVCIRISDTEQSKSIPLYVTQGCVTKIRHESASG